MKKYYGVIYKIRNTINKKCYVGKTTESAEKRFSRHCRPSNKCCPYLARSIAKYGRNNFELEILYYSLDAEDLAEKEIYFISTFNTTAPFGYNLTHGGEGARHIDQVKDRIRRSHLGKKLSIETRLKISLARKGKPGANKGKKFSAEIRKKLSLAHLGRIPSNRKAVEALKNGIVIKIYDSISEAEKDGFYQQLIQKCLKGEYKQHKGYQWRYHER